MIVLPFGTEDAAGVTAMLVNSAAVTVTFAASEVIPL